MTRLVVDTSVALSWCFADESNPYAGNVLRMLETVDAVVPSVWPLEIANAIVMAERRGRLRGAEARRFLLLLQSLPVAVDPKTSARALDETLLLARERALSAYDAAYLELAVREGLPLATLDDGLRKAAVKVGVAVADV